MTFEEFEKADGRALRAEAKERFDYTKNPNCGSEFRIACLLEAQFYMQEIDRKSDSWIARRDF